MDALRPAPGVVIPMEELVIKASASGGPGGQHANTSNTRIDVILDIGNSPSIPDWARTRLVNKLGLVVKATERNQRSQLRNRELALERLQTKLADALVIPKGRRKTKATLGSKKRRLETKSQRSQTKANRRRPGRDD